MDLIPIPHEGQPAKALEIAPLSCAIDGPDKIIAQTTARMVKYLAEGKNFSSAETDNLLMGLQRSVILIQKQKRKNLGLS